MFALDKFPSTSNMVLSAWMKALYLLLIVLVAYFLGSFFSFVYLYACTDVQSLADIEVFMREASKASANRIHLLSIQAIIALWLFVFSSLAYMKLIDTLEPSSQFVSRKLTIFVAILGVFALWVGLPWIGASAYFNHSLSFDTEWWHWMVRKESESAVLSSYLLGGNTILEGIYALIVIAVIPAIGEELLFRGCLQTYIFKRLSPHLAILLTAFIFSAIHFQFLGFIPRFLLGVMLGYAMHWSKSLVLPILMHFANNGLVVVLMILKNMSVISFDPTENTLPDISVWVGSLLLSLGLLYTLYKSLSQPSYDGTIPRSV